MDMGRIEGRVAAWGLVVWSGKGLGSSRRGSTGLARAKGFERGDKALWDSDEVEVLEVSGRKVRVRFMESGGRLWVDGKWLVKASGVVAREVVDAMAAADAIVDGIEGVISERGRFPDEYWKKGVLVKWRRLRRGGASVRELWELLDDLVDGLEGWMSETGDEGPYWKVGVLDAGLKASAGLLGLMRRGA